LNGKLKSWRVLLRIIIFLNTNISLDIDKDLMQIVPQIWYYSYFEKMSYW